ncbi:MAG: DUF2804 domain-containing protein [Desulfobacterales bacterium]|nr:DUF2804 domain-containing protein [Desulfobacterales bacterium]
MKTLIDNQGNVSFGIIENPIDMVNYKDYPLKTPMGTPIPFWIRHFLFHQFFFVGLSGPEYIAGLAVVDLKYITNGFFYIYDRNRKKLFEKKALQPPFKKYAHIVTTPEQVSAHFSSKQLNIQIEKHHVSCHTKDIGLEIDLDTSSTKPLRLCSRAGYNGWVYTQKTTPVSCNGKLNFGGQSTTVSSPQYMALMDWTAGYMRRETFWNWAAITSVLPDGRSLGLNLSCGVNETSFTENGFWINGHFTKVDTVSFEYNRDDLFQPWKIRSFDNKVNLTFRAETHRTEKINAVLIASRFTQLIGIFEGSLTTDTSETSFLSNCVGWTEDHFAKW